MFYRIMRKTRSSSKGFTLVELMIVVVVIGVLVAIAIPQYANVTRNAERTAVEANLRTIDGAIMMYRAAEGVNPASTSDLTGAAGTLTDWPTGPAEATYDIATIGGQTRAVVSGNAGGVTFTATTNMLETLPW